MPQSSYDPFRLSRVEEQLVQWSSGASFPQPNHKGERKEERREKRENKKREKRNETREERETRGELTFTSCSRTSLLFVASVSCAEINIGKFDRMDQKESEEKKGKKKER